MEDLPLKYDTMVRVKTQMKKGRLKAKVKYPLVGGAELELGSTSRLKALIKVPFLIKAKLTSFLKLEKDEKEKK